MSHKSAQIIRLTCPASRWLSAAVILVGASGLVAQAATNLSVWAFPSSSGRMIRQPDALGNRVLDYSGVGYLGGTVPIPNVPVKATISPVAGDDGATIQEAINAVKLLSVDMNGFRGAVLLTAGEYQISSSITIDASGIVLRGVGDGSDTNFNTILRATGTNQRTLVIVSGSGSLSYSSSARNITNNYVPVGARSFNVDNLSGLAVGSRVMVNRPSTANWIQAIGMDQVTPAWTAGSFDIYFDRAITRIEGNLITLDEPIANALEQQYGGGTIRPYTWSGVITNVGIEYLRGVSDFDPAVTSTVGSSPAYPADENHGWIFIEISAAVANAWVRNVTDQYFGYACVSIAGAGASSACTRNITVRDCNSLDPVSIITGSRRYAFVLNDCHHILFQNCYTRKDRHQFVTQSLTPGPNVFVDGLSDIAYNECGPHFRWATGAIWDNVTVSGDSANGVLAVRNRGDSGTSHGWAGANEVVWNSTAADANGGFTVENPPTARNWLIGSIGKSAPAPQPPDSTAAIPYPATPGTYDSPGTNVFPNSLYYAQLQDRLAAPSLETREYWIGDIDQFITASATGEVVTVDSTWRSAVQSAVGAAKVNGFDIVTNAQWIPFTFNFSLSVTDRIVGATLALAMRSTNSASTNEVLYLDSISNSNSFSSLGWLPVGTGTNTTVRVLDLGAQLSLLADGQLNVALADDVGIDWAMLELQVAPILATDTNFYYPVADAYVRGGVNATSNFGTTTTLAIKTDNSADNQRRAFLRWNLSGNVGDVVHARVRLTPVGVGTNGLENGITLAASNQWNETSINWNNRPVGGKRFATWIPAANVPVEFVVTPQVQAALARDGELSLELFSLSNVGGPGTVSYASREHADPSVQPQLLLVTTTPPVVITPPQIINCVWSGTGVFTLSGIGPASAGYRIFATTNLASPFSNWTATATGNFSGGVFNFTDVLATNYPQRFYRVVTP